MERKNNIDQYLQAVYESSIQQANEAQKKVDRSRRFFILGGTAALIGVAMGGYESYEAATSQNNEVIDLQTPPSDSQSEANIYEKSSGQNILKTFWSAWSYPSMLVTSAGALSTGWFYKDYQIHREELEQANEDVEYWKPQESNEELQ